MTRPDFFVVGTGRSGTTLVRALLTGHERVTIPSETGFVPRLLRLQPLWWGRGRVRKNVFTRLAMANGRLERAGVTREDLLSALEEAAPGEPVEAVSAIFDCFAPASQIVGDKTPGYVRHVALLAGAFPDAQFIRLVRHPLDVVASLRSQPWGPGDARAAATVWRCDQRSFDKASQKIYGRAMTVRLEDIVDNPQAQAERMAEALGIRVSSEMFAFTRRADEIASQNIHPDSHSGLQHGLRRTRAWQEELTEEEAAAAWALVQDVAVPLGYEGPPQVGQVTKRNFLMGWAMNAGFVVSRQGRRLKTLVRLFQG